MGVLPKGLSELKRRVHRTNTPATTLTNRTRCPMLTVTAPGRFLVRSRALPVPTARARGYPSYLNDKARRAR